MNEIDIYISTSAVKNPFDLENIVNEYVANGITNIELGSSHHFVDNINKVLDRFKGKVSFVVHNYFPPPEKAFALNLSSIEEDVRIDSIQHAKKAIDLCAEINSPIYSIHAGMMTNPRKIEFFEGFTFDEVFIDQKLYELCFNKLIQSCKEINEYAKHKNIQFAIENSGGHPDKYKYLMMTRREEFERLLSEIDDRNFGVLFDIGHYNISRYVYPGESIERFISHFKHKIFQVHLHRNDGSNDQHLSPTLEEIKLLSMFSNETIVVLESMKNDVHDILNSLSEIKSYLSNL